METTRSIVASLRVDGWIASSRSSRPNSSGSSWEEPSTAIVSFAARSPTDASTRALTSISVATLPVGSGTHAPRNVAAVAISTKPVIDTPASDTTSDRDAPLKIVSGPKASTVAPRLSVRVTDTWLVQPVLFVVTRLTDPVWTVAETTDEPCALSKRSVSMGSPGARGIAPARPGTENDTEVEVSRVVS